MNALIKHMRHLEEELKREYDKNGESYKFLGLQKELPKVYHLVIHLFAKV